ncbi:conserved protein of unknown function [Denitratisoma oestradiolicum]|uniref:Uncharacterized protein n=2 Tax=Denitratisoma oestradiolicum TaxID=311182 RepID=A0A6S6XWV4_9PROT|nr:hypothetical protein CBW56_13920 [Denitratisoma oestradiolicum]CAB1370474.1 conserved protein of unknown function [Denitratisoma oestradiolicum]
MNAMAEMEFVDRASSPAALVSYLYGLLGECFGYPDADLVESIRSGALRQQLQNLCFALDKGLCLGLDLSPLHDAEATEDALAVEYTRLFDAGAHGTGCSLNGGLQQGPQMKVMEEAVRFYNHFGLTLTEDNKELPDHITTELNFLHFLAYGEHQLTARGESAAACQLAQRDFIARHPGRWIPLMAAKLEPMQPDPLFMVLTQLLERLLNRELARLEALHGAASLKPSGDLPFGGI